MTQIERKQSKLQNQIDELNNSIKNCIYNYEQSGNVEDMEPVNDYCDRIYLLEQEIKDLHISKYLVETVEYENYN